MMRKNYLLTMMMVLLGLLAGVGTMRGQELKVYFASLKAQTSPTSTGSGDVKLTWVDITGKPMEVPLAKQLNWAAYSPSANWEGVNVMLSLQTIGQIKEKGQYTEDEAREYNAELDGALNSTDGLTEEQAAAYNAAMSASKEAGNTLSDEEAAAYNATLSGAKSAGDWKPEPVEGARAFDGPGATAQVIGGTMVAMDGVEVAQEMGSQIYMTSYVYYHAEVVPAAGSYLAGWTFTDPAISRIDTAMGHNEYMPGDWNEELQDYLQLDPDNSIPFRSPCFKVLPDTTNNAPFVDGEEAPYTNTIGLFKKAQEVANTPAKVNNIYAVFNKYLLSDPTATSGQLEAESGNTATMDLYFSVNGDITQFKDNYADFDFPAQSFYEDANGTWTWDFADDPVTFLDATTARAHVKVKYTAKEGITAGTHTATITVKMKGTNPSTLNIALSVVALDPDRPEAMWFDGNTEKTSGDLSEMLDVKINTYTNPILKINKPVATDLSFSGKDFTLDLNGNTAQAITVSGGNVTIAFSKFGGSATSLTVNGGKAILNGGTFGSLTIGANGTVEQNGATITGAATNDGTLTTTNGTFNGGLTSSKTLTLGGGTFNGTTAVTISGGTADINRGDITGTTLGLKVTGGTVNVKKLAAITSEGDYSAQRTGGTLNVECGKFGKPLNGTVNFTSGFFKDQNYGVSAEGYTEMLISAGVEYNEGYRYFLGDAETAKTNGVPVCRIGTVGYAKLEDALAYANNNPGVANIVIFMLNDYTLPAGYYTLPANATLVVPMSDTQAKEINMTAPRVVFNDERPTTPYTSIMPTEFRRLTFASGVNMDVFGDIELTCSQYASNEAYTSQPVGPYGRLVMEEGSHMTLQDGSEFRAWGFMTGKGETDARRGSKVREMFQLGDWKGAMTSVQIVGMFPLIGDESEKKIFPVTQYFIQNVEAPVKYHPGSLLSTSAAVSEGLGGMSVSMAATDIGIVGVSRANSGGEDDPAIFLMDVAADADNTWVRKWYDAENDIQVYDINSGAHIGSMVLDMGELNVPFGKQVFSVPVRLNSAKFDLPLTCNFKIHLLTGGMDFKQNTSLLPGAEIEVDKEATVSVAMNATEKTAYDAWVDGGKEGDAPVCYTGALYVYDAAEWGKYAYCNEVDAEGISHKSTAYTKVVRYAPSWDGVEGLAVNGQPNVRAEQTKPASAKINVHGTFETATGFVYTSESGANIFSSNEDAGTFIFNDDAVDAGTRTVWNVKSVSTFESLTFYPARLRNGNGTYVNTSGAEAGDAYCYINDEWTTMYPDEDDPCFMVKHNTNGDIYYAKPAEYVALANGMTPNEDNTYSDAAGTGRLFILLESIEGTCQWWEVENVDNLYHCIHPNNDTYYYWDEGEDMWMEQKYTITWKNWDGTLIETENGNALGYEVTYGTMAEFLGTNPTREATIDYTYDFTGWSPALGPVTSDVTYTATFEQKDRMYTITFLNEGGTLIETQFLKHNDVPVCENMPTKIGHTLVWSPAIAAVTGDATYTATFVENPPTEYEVTFFDYDGTTVLKQSDVVVGATPDEPAIVDGKPQKEDETFGGKPATNEYTYVFDHWSPALEAVSATSIKSYTAVYREVAVKYDVRFEDENGDEIETNQYTYGETPVCSATPTKPNTAQYTYSFAWTPQIETVRGAATYRAVFTPTTNKYTVTLTSNLSGVCTFTGAGTFDYGTSITNVAVSYNDTKYTFDGWSDLAANHEDKKNTTHPSFTLTGDITLTANFTPIALSDHTVAANATWEVEEDTEVKDLIITSDGSACGQLLNPENLTIRGEAIFRQQQSFAAGQWYAVAVPWRVDPTTGIYGASGRLASGSQIYIIEFDGAAYADAGGSEDHPYWHFLHQTGADMVPGKLYMIYLTSAQSKLDFHKKAGAALQTRNLTVSTATSSIDPKYSNWNAIANPALYTADLSTGAAKYQTYDNNGDQTYTVVDEGTENLIVAKPIFVQVSTPSTVYATVPSGSSPAPRRVQQAENEAKFVVEISRNGKMADRLIVETADEKEDKYVIGQDLAKFGVSSKVAQMWINRYDAKLCANTVEFDGERAEYPLSLFAPAAGEYTITIHNSQFTIHNEDYVLYLTYNGEAIWNLSDADYTLDLNKGTDANYGLRISAKKAPEVATGCDEAIVDAQGEAAAKVLMNNQVFIIRGEKVYTIDGQRVK